jgi:hypothetical protein
MILFSSSVALSCELLPADERQLSSSLFLFFYFQVMDSVALSCELLPADKATFKLAFFYFFIF